ncbi:hypothetical protein [Streptomyces justiciae]|uniref:hypothetical protein n=1 Tax=Streptomyces justiciae TaxID=2780140 RepID=UPI0021180806|nr:hypothetical protein [Streptomyces justiciae]MCW8381524.1 hypothetical protein [Streptomyces justiciae]
MGPLIAVMGSADPGRRLDPPLTDADGALTACEEIGAELAADGCRIIVYSSEAQFIESRVVTGFLTREDLPEGSVQVRPPYEDGDIDFPQRDERPEVFDLRYEPGNDWEISFYRSLRDVDGVILVGGGRSTLVTGMICLAFGIPVYPLAAFGGSARKVWETMNRSTHHATADEVSAMGAQWGPGSAQRLVRLLGTQRERREEKQREEARSRRGATLRAGLGAVTGMLLLLLGFATIPLTYAVESSTAVNLSALIVGALATGTSGAITRTVFDRETHWARTAVLGMSAGGIAFLLFVSAQLAASPDILAGEGVRRLLFFVLAVGYVSGFTFDAVYNRLKQTEPPAPPVIPGLPTGVPGGATPPQSPGGA